eukprot:52669-Eustigmatos_ZCMA.PRE.1
MALYDCRKCCVPFRHSAYVRRTQRLSLFLNKGVVMQECVNGQRKASAAVASKAGDILGGASDVEQAKAAFTQLKSSLEDLGT